MTLLFGGSRVPIPPILVSQFPISGVFLTRLLPVVDDGIDILAAEVGHMLQTDQVLAPHEHDQLQQQCPLQGTRVGQQLFAVQIHALWGQIENYFGGDGWVWHQEIGAGGKVGPHPGHVAPLVQERHISDENWGGGERKWFDV